MTDNNVKMILDSLADVKVAQEKTTDRITELESCSAVMSSQLNDLKGGRCSDHPKLDFVCASVGDHISEHRESSRFHRSQAFAVIVAVLGIVISTWVISKGL